jgi:hypothetical protein
VDEVDGDGIAVHGVLMHLFLLQSLLLGLGLHLRDVGGLVRRIRAVAIHRRTLGGRHRRRTCGLRPWDTLRSLKLLHFGGKFLLAL